MERWRLLRPHVEDGVPLATLAARCGVPERTLRRWRADYQADGLAGLARARRSDRGRRKIPDELVVFIEGLALAPAQAERRGDPPAGSQRRRRPRLAGPGIHHDLRGRQEPRPRVGDPRAGGYEKVPGGV
ncbi:helix-turn-helix domain-containing protein [Nonomuraea sp. NPDC049269]|uniref:helix-turn-helix domain-containing protein n=1 Tax=Nonomuraea sp. NPDC049269 TaxID=3364349 RepID=UPI003722DAF4